MESISRSRRYGTTWLLGATGLLLLVVLFSGAACAGASESALGSAEVTPQAEKHHAGASTHHGHRSRPGAFGQPLDHCQSILSDLARARGLPSTSGMGDQAEAVAVSVHPSVDDGAALRRVGPLVRTTGARQPPPLILTTARLRL